MRVLIVGAHGQIGYRLVERLAPSRHEVRAMVRDPDQQPALAAAGATETVVADLERDCREAVRGIEAVVFTAGSGPHTGPDKTEAVDREGAKRLIRQAEEAGVRRFIMVSAMRTDDPAQAPERLHPYLAAKADADAQLRASGMDWTILRPGRLRDERGRGRVTLGEGLPYGEIPREDVAALLAALLPSESAYRRTLDATSGETAVREAVRRLAGPA